LRDPVIVIGGRAWPVPHLAPRQNRIVAPLLMGLAQSRESYYADLCEITFAALTRAHPALSRDAFDDMPIPLWELTEAVAVVVKQSGVFAGNEQQQRPKLIPVKPEPPDWDAIIAQVCNFLQGTTPDYWEDALTMPRLDALREEWRLHPPVNVLVAGFMGYEPKQTVSGKGVEALLSRLAPGGIARGTQTIN
jgi:hypothetical protein